jgi:hypothetical protein
MATNALGMILNILGLLMCFLNLISLLLLLLLYRLLLGLGRLFSFLILCTVGRTLWTGDRPVARPLPTHRTQHRINSHNTDTHALSGVRTHDPSVETSEDSSCLRPRRHSDRLSLFKHIILTFIGFVTHYVMNYSVFCG